MAVAANREKIYVSTEFNQPDLTNVRRPEAEIYGRSLSTIYRLGAFMIKNSLEETILSPEAAQAKAEFFTSVEEGFGTDMDLGGGLEVRDFDTRSVRNGKVMSKDLKTSISSMTEAGLVCAEETALKDRRFLPQLMRSKWDHENALIVDKMARGETSYNTRIVISPFPEEAAAESGNSYWRDIGYVPHLRRGFVQVYHATKDGLIAGSLSFDGSNKQQLRDLFSQFGIRIPEGEITDNWLKYAITGNLSEDDAKATAIAIANQAGDQRHKKNTNTVDVTAQYRSIMERSFNESYIHISESLARGYQTAEVQKVIVGLANQAHHFNERYAKALYRMRANGEQFTDDDSVVLHELLVYSTIEMMRGLHLMQTTSLHDRSADTYGDADDILAHLQSATTASFQASLSNFGADGARNHRIYSACGLSISLGETTNNNPQAVFGGLDQALEKDIDKLGPRWFKCPKGHLNYRKKPNVPEKSCKTCGADVSCKKPEPPVKPDTDLFRKQEHEKKKYENKRTAKPVISRVGENALVGSSK